MYIEGEYIWPTQYYLKESIYREQLPIYNFHFEEQVVDLLSLHEIYLQGLIRLAAKMLVKTECCFTSLSYPFSLASIYPLSYFESTQM